MRNAIRNQLPTNLLQLESLVHIQFISREHRYYISQILDAYVYTHQYRSMIVDWANQSKFTLPWFTSRFKDQKGNGLSVHFIWLLLHLKVNHLCHFTMTDEHSNEASHIVVSIHWLMKECADDCPLPTIFYLPLYKCFRENKTRHLMSFIDC